MTDPDQITSICAQYDFTNVTQLKTWINSTWFPDVAIYNQTIINNTGMTQA